MYKESRASAAETAMTLWPNQVLEIPKMVSQTIQNSGRICTACGLWKPANEFYRNSRKRGGIKSKCAQCTRIQNANRRAARLEQYRAIERDSKKRRSDARRITAVEASAGWRLKHKFGLTLGEFFALVTAQNGECAICKKGIAVYSRGRGNPGAACIDHDHATGKVRGVLCHACNTALGLFADNAERLEAAARYLARESQ